MHQPAMRLVGEVERAGDRLVAARLLRQRVERRKIGGGERRDSQPC